MLMWERWRTSARERRRKRPGKRTKEKWRTRINARKFTSSRQERGDYLIYPNVAEADVVAIGGSKRSRSGGTKGVGW